MAIDNEEPQRALLPTFEFEANSPMRSKPTNGVQGESTLVPMTDDVINQESLQWNSEQAFFAVMGGFAIENEYVSETKTKVTIRRLITIHGVLQLAKLGLIPTIMPEEISEKSKADIIAKLFVLSQITWFGLEVIGRLASALPVTPIEIHTAIHVACTIIIYLIWMNKPYDVRGSILVKDRDAKDVAALCNFYKVTSDLYAKACDDYETARVNYWKDRVVRAANNLLDYDPPPSPPVREQLTKAIKRYAISSNEPAIAVKDTKEHTLIALAPSAEHGLRILQEWGGLSENSINIRNWDLLRDNSENFAIKAVWGGWSINAGHEVSLDKGVHFLFNFLYGGGHLSAWASSSFPTAVEHWLWINSAIMLTLVPLWGSLWIIWWKAVSSKRRWLYFIRNGDLDILAAPFFFVVILTYFLARCYFLIESLISLRLLPTGAFLTVNWARYLPHVA
jgi:hypothetical protein